MSEINGPVEGTSTEAAPESTATPEPWAPVHDRVNELADSVGTLTTNFDRFLQAQQPQPEPEPDPWAALFNEPEPEPDPYQQPQGLDPQQLQAAIQAQIQKGIEQGLSPIQAQMQQVNIERADQRLGQMIPALANKPENAENRQQAFQLVSAALQNYPPEHANALSADPNFISTVWKAAEADRLAQGQAPASSDVPALEAAGGALPGGNGEPQNPVQAAYENAWSLPKGLR
jgi:hypothetical protein